MAEQKMSDRLKELSDAVDKRAARHEERIAGEKVDAPEAAPPPAEAAGDLAPLVDQLGVDAEKAGLIAECAKQFDWLKDMSPDELAKHLSENANDMQMIMLEVARKQDAAEEYTIEEEPNVAGTAAI